MKSALLLKLKNSGDRLRNLDLPHIANHAGNTFGQISSGRESEQLRITATPV